MKFKTVKDAQDYIVNRTLNITVSRMRYSGGVMDLIHVDDEFYFTYHKWSSYWTKKWKTLSEQEFSEWAQKKVIAFINDADPSYSMSSVGWKNSIKNR
jgi:hypothetical protein